MKYYKAFAKGMVCKGKQYAENTEYEEQGGDVCDSGMMHFCETPFDTLDYYPLVDDNGEFSEFAEVEPLDEVKKKNNKCASKKIRIGAKLSFRDFIKAGVDVLIEKTKGKDSSGDWAKIGSSGDGAKIGSSGNEAQIEMKGSRSVAATVGYDCMISGKKGCWIVLAEWKRDDEGKWYPACVKAGQIDGETLKEDTMYKLENGEFTEVQ